MSDELAPTEQLKADRDRLAAAFVISGLFASFLWMVMIVEAITGIDLREYGVHPGTASGLTGILTAPFIHDGERHLFANTLPIVILGTALLYGYPKASRIVVPALFLLSGLGVWLFGRDASHIGASGVTVGVMFFVFTVGVLRWDPRAIGLALVVFFLYGGMVWSVLPADPHVSYESHLAGAVVGIACAILLRKLDPAPPAKRYSWELEPEPDLADATPWATRTDAGGYRYRALPGNARGAEPQLNDARTDYGREAGMNVDELRRTLGAAAPPEGQAPPLRALWHLARDEWDAAHAVVQEEDDTDSAWVHAHLHRVEGDLANARYWYRRAQQPESHASLDEEWEAIVTALSVRA